jgi:hypothetical protein
MNSFSEKESNLSIDSTLFPNDKTFKAKKKLKHDLKLC